MKGDSNIVSFLKIHVRNIFIIMKIVMLSNFFSNHQKPLSLKFIERGHEFYFIQTSSMSEERIKLGFKDETHNYDFIKNLTDENIIDIRDIIDNADIVIVGGLNIDSYILEYRYETKKLIFRYSERIFKQSGIIYWLKNFVKTLYYRKKLKEENNSNVYLLTSSSYAKKDYNKIGLYKNKTIKFGYFPLTNEVYVKRKSYSTRLLWVGRFISWKRPFDAIRAVYELKKININVELKMVGVGPLLKAAKDLVEKLELNDSVVFIGKISNEKIGEYYINSDIFLFTSDIGEGWGAVLNESMSYGCISIASKNAGSTNFLIENEVNGFSYIPNRKAETIIRDIVYKYTKLDLTQKQQMSFNAFNTINDIWNAQKVVERMEEFYIEGILNEGKGPFTKD